MKHFFFLIGLLTAAQLMYAQGSRRIYLNKGADGGSMIVDPNQYKGGDTLVLRASQNPWTYVYVGGINASKQKPLVLINEGQVVLTTGFSVENAQHIRITGTGGKDKYGFLIKDSRGSAVSISGRSANIEVDHFHVNKASFGCFIKNEASCDTSINNWVLNYISVHDYKMQDIGIEGFYIGSTDPDNNSRPINCDGVPRYYKPSRLGNVKVYNGFIDGTGRPAIQLCGAFYGMSEIYNNVLTNIGREYNDQQGTGISIGMYTRAYIHHNTIKKTFTWGIASLGGSGLVRIEHNKIDSSGYLDGKISTWAQNIFVDTRKTSPTDSTTFIIKNNKLSVPGRDADHIFVGNTIMSYTRGGNEICNNGSAKMKVQPGVYWKKCGVAQSAAAPLNIKKAAVYGAAALCLLGFVYLVYVAVKKNVFHAKHLSA